MGCKSCCHSEVALCTQVNFVTERKSQMFTKGTWNNKYPFFPTLKENKLIGCLLLFQVLEIYLSLLRTRFSPLCVFLQNGDDWQKLILKQVLPMAVIWMADETEKGQADGWHSRGTWALDIEQGHTLPFRKGWCLKGESKHFSAVSHDSSLKNLFAL